MKRFALGLLVTMSVVLSASPAFAAKPTIVKVSNDRTFILRSCGFPVRVHTTGFILDVFWTSADGSYREFQSYPQSKQTLTNLRTGTTIRTSLSGPERITAGSDGSSSFGGTGPWAWNYNPVTLDSGLFLTEGRFVFAIDVQGNATFSIVGHVVALCPKLAG